LKAGNRYEVVVSGGSIRPVRDGWATFEYGEALRADDVHIIWRRIGSHEIFADP
jgi:hypothetical protein